MEVMMGKVRIALVGLGTRRYSLIGRYFHSMTEWRKHLAEEAIAMGGQPVAIPDFTGGAWSGRK